MKGQDQLFSSKKHDWQTPKELFDELRKEFDIQLDACTSGQNPLDSPFFYALDQDNNGLKLNWQTWTFCNPPYIETLDWLHKAWLENIKRNVSSILLLPARTDTKWFHSYVWDQRFHRPIDGVEIRFIKGRLKFGGSENSAPFPSMLVIIN